VRFSDPGVAGPAMVLLLMSVGIACRVGGRWRRLAEVTEAIALWIAFTAIGCILTYLAARNSAPLRDADFVAIDRALGFSWLLWNQWVAATPGLKAVLHVAYGSLVVQILFSCCILPFHKEARRGAALWWSAAVAILITCVLFRWLPALGTFSAFGIEERADWISDLQAMRGGAELTVRSLEMKGIVSFPSFHAVLAALFIYHHRGSGIVSAVVTGLNAAMIVATLSEGPHYLIDVVAGLGVAGVAVAIAKTRELRP
jgi:hypothetical protein